MENKNLAILLTVHNRKSKTLRCLSNIMCQIPIEGWNIEIYMTDDGSIDGTSDSVRHDFPNVKIIKGNGNLYWNRGMISAWKFAVKEKEFDGYLWLNDDTFLVKDALKILLHSHILKPNAIIVGATKSSTSNVITYGGSLNYKNQKLLEPNGELQKCGLFTGNIVLVPSYVFRRIGYLDSNYSHALGDTDYSLMAAEQGIDSYVCGKVLGMCDVNPTPPKWHQKKYNIVDRYKNLMSPLGYTPPKEYFHFKRKHWGVWRAVGSMVNMFYHFILPKK